MNKEGLIRKYCEICDINAREARTRFDETMAVLQLALEEDGEIKLNGFGRFQVRRRKGHMTHHPLTNEQVYCEPRKTVHFTAYKALLDALNERNQLIKPIKPRFGNDNVEEYDEEI